MADQLRAAVIGAGFMGTVHTRAIRRAGGTVAVLASSNIDRAVEALRSLGAERAATASEAVVADDVDVVHICAPNSLHREFAELALGRGKARRCEKPLAIDVNSARAMTAAVPAGLVTAVPFVYRFYPMVREARARVRSGELGDLHLLHGHYLQDSLSRPTDANWRVDAEHGGASRAFADIGIHWCDLVEFVSGHRLVRVIATTQTTFADRGGARPTEDAATMLFETDHGAMGAVVVSQVSPGRKNRLWIELDGRGRRPIVRSGTTRIAVAWRARRNPRRDPRQRGEPTFGRVQGGAGRSPPGLSGLFRHVHQGHLLRDRRRPARWPAHLR